MDDRRSTGFVQGAGLGFLFVPLTTITFATLPPQQRADGTGLYNLSRNIGSSVGISVVSYLLIRNMPDQPRDHRQLRHGVQSRVRQRAVQHAMSP